MFKIRFYGRSDVGRKRLTNEDSFYTSDDDQFGIVCDGMGGHQGGEIASRLAVDVMTDCVTNAGSRLFKARGRKLAHVRSLAKDLVFEWTQRANEQIFQKGGPDTPLRTRMGTTLALVLLVEDFAVVAHVGDSRIYRIRGSEIAKLTEDHSIMGPSRAPRAWGTAPKRRKYVTKALGTRATVEPDIRLEDVAVGDIFILCSDGLSDAVQPAEIAKIIEKAGNDRRVALRSLIHLANKRGGRDNITVVLAEVVAAPEAEKGEDLSETTEIIVPDALRNGAKATRKSGSGVRSGLGRAPRA